MDALPPVGLALVVCESVYRDSAGRQALVGLFNRVEVGSFPHIHPTLTIYVALTEFRPGTKCTIDIIDGESDETLLTPLEFEPPQIEQLMGTGVCELTFEFSAFPFPKAGLYMVRLLSNQQILLQRPIQIGLASSAAG